MPPARSASAATRRAPRAAPRSAPRRHPRPKPRTVKLPTSVLRVRWDRAGRIGLLFVLMIVMGLYAEHALSYVSTRAQSNHQKAIVNTLSAQNRALSRQLKALDEPATIVRDARALGMVRPGERSYAMTGQGEH